jgi:hypothetical protein
VPAGQLDWFVGLTAETNAPSIAAALAAGFERRGSIPGYFGDDDAAMLFLRRPVNG